jgi:hypothetical protein
MAIATIPQAIERGGISTYLVGNANSKDSLFGGGKIAAPGSMVSIAMITDALRWGYDDNGGAQTDEDLREVANYLVWLCGMYGQQAQAISEGSGGGTVITGGATAPGQLNFTVAASGTTLIDGQSTVTLNDFIGYNLIVNKNGTALTQIATAPVYYTWNSVNGSLTVVPAAFLGDEFQITPV